MTSFPVLAYYEPNFILWLRLVISTMNVLFLLWVPLALAWTANELEIFNLHNAVVKDLKDPKATFYSWLGLKPKAKVGSIDKAYRKLARQLHPDKNPGQDALERSSRLSRVRKILGDGRRDTYDFYLKSGFPKLGEDGEYRFNRYKPSILFAVIAILALVEIGHYVLLKVGAWRKKQYVENIINEAFNEAQVNGVVKQRRKVTLGIGKSVAVYPDGRVYLLDGGREDEIRTADVPDVSIFDTVLLKPFKKQKTE